MWNTHSQGCVHNLEAVVVVVVVVRLHAHTAYLRARSEYWTAQSLHAPQSVY